MEESRRFPRVRVHGGILFLGPPFGGGALYNVSWGGCGGASYVVLVPGALLTIEIYLPQQQEPVTIESAIVRWSQAYAFGLEFLLIDAAARARLVSFLRDGSAPG